MEDNDGEWTISHLGHKILHDHKAKLESRFKVKIHMPELQTNDCPAGEIIFVKIVGDRQKIECVKKFLHNKLESMKRQEKRENNESVIVIDSDSEDDSGNGTVLSKNKTCKPKRKKRRLEIPEITLVSLDVTPQAFDAENTSPDCEVTSTTNADESVIILDPPPVEEFIPILTNVQNKRPLSLKAPAQVDNDDDVIALSSDEEDTVDQAQQLQVIPKPIDKRYLRPIVIDGSNVARSHGKPENTFSCKGIKICVDYFLKRGHPQVTAFVPLYRQFCKSGPVKTTDQYLLEELAKTQHVVFTPSRRIDGKAYSCYDDRFIVELAAANGGVILSNDNFKDLLDESPAFAETIKNRLLMYCFVGDMLMIPADPLGLKGPKLDEYLSFPPPVPDNNS